MQSYWYDKDKIKQLQLFVIFPSGCHAEYVSVSLLSSAMVIPITYKWPEFMFQPEHLCEGQVDMQGAITANASSAKAVGLQETKETKSPHTYHHEPCHQFGEKVEPNLINLTGKVAKKQRLYKQLGNATFPALVMAIGCMVKHADDKEEVQDFE